MKGIFTLFLSLSSLALHSDEWIGKVVAYEGHVKAIAVDTSERSLQKGSPVYVADTVVTMADSKAQIQFSDGALLNLIPESEYRVNEYRYKVPRQKDRYGAELLKGGFRSLSGSIAKKNPDEVEIKTPTSTIGIRGTVLDARIISGSVYFGVEAGLVVLTNQAGSITIGVGAQTQYAVVASALTSPEPLLERPVSLERSVFIPPVGGAQIGQAAPQAAKAQPAISGTSDLAPGAPAKPSGSASSISPGC